MERLKWGKNRAVFSSYPSLRFPHAAPCLSQKSDSASRGISWARRSPPAVDYESLDVWNSSPPPLKLGQSGSSRDWHLETKLSDLFVHSCLFCFPFITLPAYQPLTLLQYVNCFGAKSKITDFIISTSKWNYCVHDQSHFYWRALSGWFPASWVLPCELRLSLSEERVRRVFRTAWASLSELSVCSAEKSESSVPSELLPAFL